MVSRSHRSQSDHAFRHARFQVRGFNFKVRLSICFQIRALQIHVLQIQSSPYFTNPCFSNPVQSMFYKSNPYFTNPVHVLQHADGQ